MGLSGHFTRMWTRCCRCELFGTCCIWVELPVQRRLYPIFVSGVGVIRPSLVFRGLTGCQRPLGFWGVTSINLKKMENKMFCYAFEGGKMVKDANGLIEYKSGQVITIFVNVNISYDEFVSLVCAKLRVESNSVKFYHTCRFYPSLMALLNDDEELMKMFRFNDNYCRVYMSSNTKYANGVILPSRYIKLNSSLS